MTKDTVSQSFFEHLYRQNADPWQFASSAYEQGRYETTFQALNHRRYQRAFEPGCSIGVLTARLASICDQVEAIDISATAVSRARDRCRDLQNVNLSCGALPDAIPDGSFDLIVISEVGYYFDEKTLSELGEILVERLTRSGTFLAVHWLGVSEDHVIGGDLVHQILGTLRGLSIDYSEQNTAFRLDRWSRL